MATDKKTAPNIDNSDLVNYPNGRIKDNGGAGDGTPVNRLIYSDLHEFFAKLMRLAAITYNGLPESEGNGYQLINAAIALAGKNDYIVPLNTSGGILQVSTLALSILQTNEALICKSAVDYASETSIAGSETGVTKTITVPSSYKANDYLRLIRTSTGITLVRLADALNINQLITELNYLKAANNTQAIAGTAINLANTPASTLAAFVNWVNGSGSATYLVSHSANGLMSAADKVILDGLNNPVKNVGWVSGIEIAGNTYGSALPVGGNISAASGLGIDAANPKAQEYSVTFQNAMPNTNYFLRTFFESQTSIGNNDASVCMPAFRNKSTNGCTIILRETLPTVQNIKMYIEVVQLS